MANTPTRYSFNPLSGNFDLVPQDPAQIATVASSGAMFTSIQSAINSITDAASTKHYAIHIAPGVYTEDITLKPFVHLYGLGNSPSACSVVGKVTSNFITTGNTCTLRRIAFSSTDAAANDCTMNLTGSVVLDSCSVVMVATTDAGAVYAIKAAPTTAAFSMRDTFIFTNRTYNGSTATTGCVNITSGTFPAQVNRNKVQLNALASNGDLFSIMYSHTGEITSAGNSLIINSNKAGYVGSVWGTKITTTSTSSRTADSERYILKGTGNTGTVAAFCLNSSGSSAQMLYANAVIEIDGFANEYVTDTATGDTQKAWLNSSNKDLGTTGVGLAIVTPYALVQSGFVEWSTTAGNFWSATLSTGTFATLKRFTGMVKSSPVVAPAGTLTGATALTDLAVNFVYVDSKGVLKSTTTGNDALYESNIPIFQVWRDGANGLVCRENHPVKFPTAASLAWHAQFGALLHSASSSLGSGLAAAKCAFTGENTIGDHGLTSTVAEAAAGFTATFVYVDGAGKMKWYATTDTFPAYYNNAGTPTLLTAGSNRWVIYRIGVIKDSGLTGSDTAQFVAVMDTVQNTSSGNATTRITSGLVTPFPPEMKALEVCQVGYVVVRKTSGSAIDTTNVPPTTALQVFGAQYVSGGTSTAASLITANTTDFNGQLSGTETNVQLALDRLDDYGFISAYATGVEYRVGNPVLQNGCVYRCNTLLAAVANTAWTAAKASFTQVSIARYADVTAAESANANDGDLCYVTSTETFYRYVAAGGAYTRDGTYVLNTGDAGDTRRLAVAGKYVQGGINAVAGVNGMTALATAEPGAVSSSTSGQVGTSTKVAREDHNHDLGTHDHTGATNGGQLSSASVSDFTEAAQDAVGAALVSNPDLLLQYTDATPAIEAKWRGRGKNFVTNPDAELNTTGLSSTGASTVTIARETTSPLFGLASYKLTQATAAAWEVTWTVNTLDLGLVSRLGELGIVMKGAALTGGYLRVKSDSTVVFEQTAAGNLTLDASNPKKFGGIFPIGALPATFTITLGGTGAISGDLLVDQVYLGEPVSVSSGVVGTEWTTYTAGAFGNQGTLAITQTELKWRRSGPNLYVQGTLNIGAGTGSAGTFTIPFPSGLALSGLTKNSGNGNWLLPGTTTSKTFSTEVSASGSDIYLIESNDSTSYGVIQGNELTSGHALYFTAGPFPISGWAATDIVTPESSIRTEISANATAVVATYPNPATIASIVLTPGKWNVQAFDSFYNGNRGAAGSSAGGADLYDGSSVIADNAIIGYWNTTTSDLDVPYFPSSLSAVVTVSPGTTKTITFRVRCDSASGTPTGAETGSRGYGKLFAVPFNTAGSQSFYISSPLVAPPDGTGIKLKSSTNADLMTISDAGAAVIGLPASPGHNVRGAGTAISSANTHLRVMDTAAQATGVGGGLAFLGIYNSSGDAYGPVIKSSKVNSTNGDYGFNLDFYSAGNGVTSAIGGQMNSAGAWTWGANTTASGHTAQAAKGINAFKLGVTTGSMAANEYTSLGFLIRNSAGGVVASSGDSTGVELRAVQPGTAVNEGQLEIYTRADATTLTKAAVADKAGAWTWGPSGTNQKQYVQAYNTPRLVLKNALESKYWSVASNALVGDGLEFNFSTDDSTYTNKGYVSTAGAWTLGAATTGTTVTSKGFTALGDGNTAIKVKVLTGTTAAAEGGTVTIAHGLTGGKIVGIQPVCRYGTNVGVPPAITFSAGYQYDAYFSDTNIIVVNHATNSENILSKPISVTVTYVE